MKSILKIAFALSTNFCFSIAAFAFSSDALKDLDFSFAVGPSWYHSNNASTVVTTDERDTNITNGMKQTTTYRLGLGYHLFSKALSQRVFFNDLLIQMNLSHGDTTIPGSVEEFGSPDWTTFSFNAPLNSTSLMLDLKPSLFTFHHVSPYPILGLGVAWNRISLTETAYNAQDHSDEIYLPSTINRTLAYDLGFGLRMDITKNWNASLEYLFSDLGKITPTSVSSSSQNILSAPAFPVHRQNLLFVVGWKF
jgi:opacity protein-like surface antigen